MTKTNYKKGRFIMNTITQILNNINLFSKSNFKFSKYIEFFNLIKSIPGSVEYKLNTDDFIFHLSQAQLHMDWLIKYFDESINPVLKKEYNKLKITKVSHTDKTIPYADFTVDQAPIFDRAQPEQLDFHTILMNARDNGKEIKPIKRRNNKVLTYKGICVYCGAPNDYLYLNNNKGQMKCKCCENTFTDKVTLPEEEAIYCPYCKCRLELHHDRNNYIVYRCPNKKCSYYLNNKELVDEGKGERLKTSSGGYKLHYQYRDFKFNMDSLKKADRNIKTPVKLSRIYCSSRVLGLILTYYVNYGLSSRKTALIMKEVHGLKISHQTVLNYANTVSAHVKPLVDNYPYKLNNLLSGDETYIKVRGKNQYVFFWSDPVAKIITSYTIYKTRNTFDACRSIMDCFRHYDKIPEDMTMITDGNPIYNAAQLFFHINGIDFVLHQVIGVKNLDEESAKYRPYKQTEERLNRTYKMNYYGTNGYDKLETANVYMVLYVCFFNFLRQHSTLGYKTPVDDGLFEENDLMPDKWLKLIQLSEQYHLA